MKYRTFQLVKHHSPFDKSLEPTDADYLMDSNSTAAFRVFDKDAQTPVTEVPTSATIKCGNASAFKIGDKVQVIRDDNTELIANVDAVDTTLNTITLDSAPDPQLTAGSPIRLIYGPAGSQVMAMALAGNPVRRVGEQDWYWQGLMDPDDFSDLVPGIEVEIETVVTKTAGTKVNSIASKCDVVEADCGA